MAEQIARETGLKPKTVATQELQEESGSAAEQREAERNFDALNIGYDDSGPLGLTQNSEWSNPKAAAKATSEFFKGKKFGPSEGIKAILPQAKGKSVAKQLETIGNSGWATSEYAKDLAATSDLVGEKSDPGAIKNLKEAKLAAKELGLKVGQSPGKPAKQVVTRYKAGLKAAETLAHSHLPYVWGGGHGSIEKDPTGLDCSGAVSWVLAKMGVLKSPLTSGSMGTVLKPGPGAVTVFYNGGHTFMKIGEKYFGTSVDDSSRGLSFYKAPPQSYLDTFNVGHVPGLGKKQAIQLGFKLPSGGNPESFPGMTVSSSGTTATIDSGAGTTQTKPGLSSQPIRSLSAPQRIAQAEKTLEAGDLKAGQKAEAPTTSVLSELTRKYGAAA
jgi:cell wall-associated NlpC family hydrolase